MRTTKIRKIQKVLCPEEDEWRAVDEDGKLRLYRCGLTELPESIGELDSLKSLFLQRNQLKELPESIGNLKSLEFLDLEKNQLTELPESIGELDSLESMYLRWNQLESLPDSIGNLKSLERLDLLGNQLTELPESIGNLDSITTLYLYSNQLETLPDSIGNLESLISLDLKKNQLKELPDSIGNFESLRELDLKKNQLKELPDSIGNLNSLERLNLEKNQLKSLPDSIGNLNSLERLNLEKNQLETLPDSIGNLESLDWLYLQHNQLIKYFHPSISSPLRDKLQKLMKGCKIYFNDQSGHLIDNIKQNEDLHEYMVRGMNTVEVKLHKIKEMVADPIKTIPKQSFESECKTGTGKLRWDDGEPLIVQPNGDYMHLNDDISPLKFQISQCNKQKQCLVLENKIFDVLTDDDTDKALDRLKDEKESLECANTIMNDFERHADEYRRVHYI